jgi:hypothetical protein
MTDREPKNLNSTGSQKEQAQSPQPFAVKNAKDEPHASDTGANVKQHNEERHRKPDRPAP